MSGKGNGFFNPRGMNPLERAKLEKATADIAAGQAEDEDVQSALIELAEMIIDQEDALVEIAEIIGGE